MGDPVGMIIEQFLEEGPGIICQNGQESANCNKKSQVYLGAMLQCGYTKYEFDT